MLFPRLLGPSMPCGGVIGASTGQPQHCHMQRTAGPQGHNLVRKTWYKCIILLQNQSHCLSSVQQRGGQQYLPYGRLSLIVIRGIFPLCYCYQRKVHFGKRTLRCGIWAISVNRRGLFRVSENVVMAANKAFVLSFLYPDLQR